MATPTACARSAAKPVDLSDEEVAARGRAPGRAQPPSRRPTPRSTSFPRRSINAPARSRRRCEALDRRPLVSSIPRRSLAPAPLSASTLPESLKGGARVSFVPRMSSPLPEEPQVGCDDSKPPPSVDECRRLARCRAQPPEVDANGEPVIDRGDGGGRQASRCPTGCSPSSPPIAPWPCARRCASRFDVAFLGVLHALCLKVFYPYAARTAACRSSCGDRASTVWRRGSPTPPTPRALDARHAEWMRLDAEGSRRPLGAACRAAEPAYAGGALRLLRGD